MSSDTPLPSQTSSTSMPVKPFCWWYCTTARRAGTMPSGPTVRRGQRTPPRAPATAEGVLMSRRLVNITLDNLDDLPRRCRKCVFWELDPVAGARASETGDTELEKEAWVSAVLLEWGSCGKICYVDGVLAGYVLFAPPSYVPRSVAFPTSPVSAVAALLMTAELLPDFGGGGPARRLAPGVA